MTTSFPIELPILILAGPTAVGKTALSIAIAHEYDCEIISVDSMQVYKYMNIGTAKITEKEKEGVPHHLIDIVDPHDNYDAGQFMQDALQVIRSIHQRGKTPLLTGGTGLYYKALLEGISEEIPAFPDIRKAVMDNFSGDTGNEALYEKVKEVDPESYLRLHQNDTQRLMRALEVYEGTGVRWSELIEKDRQSKQTRFSTVRAVCLTRSRDDLYSRIDRRCTIMLQQGFEDEVAELLSMGYNLNDKSMNSIGYKHMCLYLNERCTKDQMRETMARDTRRYAKRQLTWFKKMQGLNWIDVNNTNKIMDILQISSK